MQHRIITSVAVLMGALLLAIITGVVPVFPFSTEETAHAQTSDRPDDATLSSLVVGEETLTLVAGTTEYTARVENLVNVVIVTPVTNNSDATYSISPGDAIGSTIDVHDVSLRAGQNTRITVTVRAENRITRQIYTVMVYRARSTLSEDQTLSALSLVAGVSRVSLSPRFSSGTTEYDARVRYDVTMVTVKATAADIGARGVIVDVNDSPVDDNVVSLVQGMPTVITVTVTPESGAPEPADNYEYEITVYRESGPVLSDVATLSALTVAPATIAGFAAGMTEYTTRLTTGEESVNVEWTLSGGAPGATVDIMPADQNLLTDDVHEVYLTPGTNTEITVTVTAEDRSTNTYTVTIYRPRSNPSDDQTLSALSLIGADMSPRFSSGTTEYDARVRYDVTMVTVEATAADIGASEVIVDVNDSPVDDNVVSLVQGMPTVITVTVTPESGAPEPADNYEYKITVYRESGPVLSDVATLSALTVAPATIAGFAVGMTEYTTSVANAVASVNVEWTLSGGAPGATVDIMPADQNLLTDDDHEVYLTAGVNNEITVTVTAEDGSTNTYTVTIYRARLNSSDDATLSALRLAGVSLSPDFDPKKLKYDARVRYNVDKVTVEATAADIGATTPLVTVTDGTVAVVDNVVTLGLQGTATEIKVAVTSEGGPANEADDYTITVYRENIVLSDVATLAAPDNGMILGADVTLTPGFVPSTNEYTARAIAIRDFATVDATPSDTGAMVDIMPADRDSLTGGHQVYLAPGAHTAITVTVKAEDGTSTNTYTFMVYRLNAPASDDVTLSALSLSGAVLSPVFDPERKDYTATASYNTDITTVTATANDIGAMVPMINSAALVVVGGNQVTLSDQEATRITITVMAEDTTTSTDPPYTIVVYRDAAPSSDATLETLTLSDLTLSPAFDPATTEYTAEVETLDMTTVVATTAHPGATVQGTGDKVLAEGEHEIIVTVTAEDGETSQTYTVTVTVLTGKTLLEIYDTNGNDQIDKNEAVVALGDYLADEISKADMVAVIRLYLFG